MAGLLSLLMTIALCLTIFYFFKAIYVGIFRKREKPPETIAAPTTQTDLSNIPDRQCPTCGSLLRRAQVERMIGNSQYQQWCREGYCSLKCYETISAGMKPTDETSAVPPAPLPSLPPKQTPTPPAIHSVPWTPNPSAEESRAARFALGMTKLSVIMGFGPAVLGFLLILVIPSAAKGAVLLFLGCVAANAFLVAPVALVSIVIAAVTRGEKPMSMNPVLMFFLVLISAVGGFVLARVIFR